MRTAGVDEAGRGPVIGPMVLGLVIADEKTISEWAKKGVRDSKKVSRQHRKKLYQIITKSARLSRTFIISVQSMNHTSLTNCLLKEIYTIGTHYSADTWIFDALGHPTVNSKVQKLFASWNGCNPSNVIIEPRADMKYIVVSAASILAKVTRDRIIQKLWEKYGYFGWGYPSEQATRDFITKWYQQHHTLPPIVRTRWSTINKLISNTL